MVWWFFSSHVTDLQRNGLFCWITFNVGSAILLIGFLAGSTLPTSLFTSRERNWRFSIFPVYHCGTPVLSIGQERFNDQQQGTLQGYAPLSDQLQEFSLVNAGRPYTFFNWRIRYSPPYSTWPLSCSQSCPATHNVSPTEVALPSFVNLRYATRHQAKLLCFNFVADEMCFWILGNKKIFNQ